MDVQRILVRFQASANIFLFLKFPDQSRTHPVSRPMSNVCSFSTDKSAWGVMPTTNLNVYSRLRMSGLKPRLHYTPSRLHRKKFCLYPHIFLSIWCSHAQHYAPTQNLVFIHSTNRTHTKCGVHTLNNTHPHKLWCSYTQHHAPTQNLVFMHSTLRTHTKFGVHALNNTHPHKIPGNNFLFIWTSAL
jgi:hypothetical protein